MHEEQDDEPENLGYCGHDEEDDVGFQEVKASKKTNQMRKPSPPPGLAQKTSKAWTPGRRSIQNRARALTRWNRQTQAPIKSPDVQGKPNPSRQYWAKWDPDRELYVCQGKGSTITMPREGSLSMLMDDDGAEIFLGQLSPIADEQKEKMGYVRISAVVDSGAETHALPEDVATWLPLEPSESSKAGKSFRGANGDPIPAKGKRVLVGRTGEGQSKRISWEVCPVKRPLLSVAKMAQAGNIIRISENRASILNIKSGLVTPLRRERNVWMLDLWVKKDSGFPRPGN